ncbi:probable LRR receptor-like serine/threonine-protein kinase At1g07650 [Fagus crenata]
MQVLTQSPRNTKSVEEKMSRQAQNSRIGLTLIKLMLLQCMGVIIQVKAQAGRLPDDEVKALVEIAAQVGKKGWNFKVAPCSNESSWATPKSNSRPLYNNSLISNCSYPHGACHVVQFDLTRNYLSGNIPREWASTKLEYLSIESNLFSGMVPIELGKLVNIENP